MTYATQTHNCPDCGEPTYEILLPDNGCVTDEGTLLLDIDEVKALRKTLKRIENQYRPGNQEVCLG